MQGTNRTDYIHTMSLDSSLNEIRMKIAKTVTKVKRRSLSDVTVVTSIKECPGFKMAAPI